MKRRLVNDGCDGTRWLFCGRLLIYTVDDLISPGTQWLRLHGSRVPGRASAVQRVLLQTHPQTGVSATCSLWNTEALFSPQAYPVCGSNLRARSGLVVTVTTSAFEAGCCSVSKCRPRMCVRRLNRILGLRSQMLQLDSGSWNQFLVFLPTPCWSNTASYSSAEERQDQAILI